MPKAHPIAPATIPVARAGRPVRVVHVLGCLDRGGIETASLDLCRSIPPTEVHQTFVTTGGWLGALADDYRAAGADVTQCPGAPRWSFLFRMWWLLRRLRPDAVVGHIKLTSAPILLVARLCGVPVRVARMWSESDCAPDTPVRRAKRAVYRWLLPRAATDVLGVTGATLDFTGRRGRDSRYRVLYNGFAADRITEGARDTARQRWRLPLDAPVLGYLGRSAPVKNRPFLVEVHRAARVRQPDVRLLVAGARGTDDITDAHPDVVHDPQVVLAGEVEQIGPVLVAADVLLLPSLTEGLPGVVLEALASGLPVVANDLPCMRELAALLPGVTLVPLAAGADRWAEAALDQAALGGAEREALRKALRSSPFTLDHVSQEWRRVWGVPAPAAPVWPLEQSAGRR
ncbi:glycosyltransferase [Micromonospora sp. NPDC049282]|uniref:glycosyltransferase n=1 Tax=Micromonospora sp. NPDC049282 TaxID=3364269 RepID=UPI0037136364